MRSKPRIILMQSAPIKLWACGERQWVGIARTPKEAYDNWLLRERGAWPGPLKPQVATMKAHFGPIT
jgi:hypothetical protein